MTSIEQVKKYNEFMDKLSQAVPGQSALVESIRRAFKLIQEAWGQPDVNLVEKAEEIINNDEGVRQKFNSCVDDCTKALANALNYNPSIEKVDVNDGQLLLGRYRVDLFPAVGKMLNDAMSGSGSGNRGEDRVLLRCRYGNQRRVPCRCVPTVSRRKDDALLRDASGRSRRSRVQHRTADSNTVYQE